MTEDKSPAVKNTDGVVAVEDLDNIINQVDPGFTESLEGIKKEAVTDSSAIEALQVDSQVDVSTEDEAAKSLKGRIFAWLFSPFVRLKDWFRLRLMALTNRTRLFKDQSIQFLKHELPERLRYFKGVIISWLQWVAKQLKLFMALSRAQKAALFVSIALVVGGFFVISKSLTGHWLPTWRNPIVASFAPHADFVRKVKDQSGYVEFFEAFPEVEIPFLLTKIIVNLTPSPGSSHPMGAFEFYLGLDAKETAIEVKDREKEILDLVQRTVEEFTYDEVMAQVGQTRMKARIRDAINTLLNQGRVSKVYINTMVTNH